jgi:hypothetical protein
VLAGDYFVPKGIILIIGWRLAELQVLAGEYFVLKAIF